jgi:2-polyprenyl-3-methyl-5-hydroxy-6-metoxy-1,4-benzoquinol methylase
VSGFSLLPRVTSDCLPFRQGGKLAVCQRCSAVQAVPDEQWLSETKEIYGKYDVYHQSGGVEQHVFSAPTGRMRPRSEVLVENLQALPGTPRSGRLLDVGCGNGVTLRAFAQLGGWTLHGLELHDRNLASLSAIAGFQTLHTCAPEELSESFDLITVIHALEHFPDPCTSLRQLRSRLQRGGALFVQVPNAAANPFDYVVADHLCHFSPRTIEVLLQRAGFRRIKVFTDWIVKEISVLAWEHAGDAPPEAPGISSPVPEIQHHVNWLNSVIAHARRMAAGSAPFGLFGSSISATWLWSTVSDRVEFFVEEDPSRIGRQHLGCPILSPQQVPPGSLVFMPLAAPVAASIRHRLQYLPFHLCMPVPDDSGGTSL